MFTLENKVAVITGASSGIGRATAQLFAKQGARVVVAARREPELASLVESIEEAGGQAVAVAGDIQQEDFARELVERCIARFSRLDIAVNNAATLGALCPTLEMSTSAWRETLATNLSSGFFAAKQQIPAMLATGGGSLIFTSTFVGHQIGLAGMADYAASKAGLIGLTRALASEFGGQGLRVNALIPGGTDTPMGRTYASSPEALAFVEGLHALGRMAKPEEIAQSALYLASDAASFTTGSTLYVDGGASMHR